MGEAILKNAGADVQGLAGGFTKVGRLVVMQTGALGIE